jgi:glucokinase
MVRLTRQRLQADRPATILIDHEGLSSKDIYEAAQAGDAFAREMFQEVGYYLGMGLVTAINLLNVQVVALTGGLAGAGELIFDPVRRTVAEYGLEGVKEFVRITQVELGEDAALLGAARIAIDASSG